MPAVEGREVRSEQLAAITADVPLTRGLGRAYGDAALPGAADRVVAGSVLANRILAFDSETGVLRAEAGFSLDQLYRVLLPRGWFTPVTPGTRFVTVGGMVAADVHGKNHHVDGCIGGHVRAITLRVADGRVVTCAPDTEPELFWATVGGMGLTGHILDVTLQLVRVPSPWIVQEAVCVPDIEAFVEGLRAAAADWPMTAGWMDGLASGRSLGRGVVLRGRWAAPHEAPRPFPALKSEIVLPFTLPAGVLGAHVVRPFNAAFYRYHRRRYQARIVTPEAFLYPLDRVGAWNRAYGPRGFIQYQCVLPARTVPRSVRQLLEIVARHRGSPLLAVLKDCGHEGQGLLSFPLPGLSVALDMPFRETTQRMVDEMNALVVEHGGRVYLAKDALTRAEDFRAMEPRLDRFLAVRQRWDPEGRLRSALSRRLFGW